MQESQQEAAASRHTGLLGSLRTRMSPLQKEQGVAKGSFHQAQKGGVRNAQ